MSIWQECKHRSFRIPTLGWSVFDMARSASLRRSRAKIGWMLLATGAARTCLPSHGICKCSSIETYDQDPPADDGLWHEAHLETRVSYHSTEVLAVIGDIERWVDLFPWCSCSTFLHEQESGRQYYKVHFGLSMGPVFIGDIVTYEVTRSSSSLKLVAVNGQDLKYCDFLVYTFTMRDGLEDGVKAYSFMLDAQCS
eukprot:CAMPEP_0169147814 /NCGR_PEP_ID=MMETSP1015-20121227/48458_1 /TAXON_ID=342587 /ORGANISM="Karlodinium micrum, Strain CCMP2283" /LENGTH=195 /DNA_ID=CAMNT_0009216121 /DNA_START=32 /DNA_END=619 /DNA_ORIENTATION=+